VPSVTRNSPPRPIAGADIAAARRQWRQQIEREDLEALYEAGWFPVSPKDDPSVVFVFGGTVRGWEALLTTMGAALLGEGRRLTVLNLSQRSVASVLQSRLGEHGYSAARRTVSSVGSALGAFNVEVGEEDLLSLIMRVTHPQGGKAERLDAMADRNILETITRQLGEMASVGRLRAGLRVILGNEPIPSETSLLSKAEFREISDLYSEDVRSRTDILSRSLSLEQHLSRLDIPSVDEIGEKSSDLQVLDVDPELGIEDFDEIGEVLIELLTSHWRSAADLTSEAIVLCGALERLDSRLIETLANIAERKRARLVMLFERLRQDAPDAIGLSNSCHAFMRLTDNRDAAAACEFIGREDKYVIAQTTRQRGNAYERGHNVSVNTTWGQTRSATQGPFLFGSSTTTALNSGGGESEGNTEGRTESDSVSITEELKTEQLVVRPVSIQGLPETALFVIAEIQPRTVKLVDCDSNLVFVPRMRPYE
jgi:hypothetical protein